MTIHTVRLDIITTMDRSDTIAITIIDHLRLRVIMGHLIMGHITDMGHLTSIDLIAISRSDHLIRRVIMGHHIMGHLIMGHLTSIAHLLTEVVDKKCNEI